MITTPKHKTNSTDLESYFNQFRKHIIGIDQEFESPFGLKKILYTDWTASGRLYRPIEEKLCNEFGPYVANTHTETTVSGTAMTKAYHKAKHIIKNHVHCNEDDVLIVSGNGMTGVVNKFQRILGLKVPENIRQYTSVPDEIKPVVFVSHMEHHSNHTSWLETIAKVEVIPPGKEGLFSLENLEELLLEYKDYTLKIASVIGGSNVTGIETPYHDIAELMHKHGGVCFVDFACSAPYVNIDMHPENEDRALDAIFFSPHKFLGGPGTCGVLIFNKKLYKNMIPDCPGGGTVSWTNPWGEHKYIDNIEDREDGGTPGFLQTIKTALAIKLKEQMGVKKMLEREHQILNTIFKALEPVKNLHILAEQHKERLGVISFYIDELHYNLGVKLLNDRFGIQTRGGCSCAGTYGHYLLHVDYETSHELTNEITIGDLVRKPGWIRLSIHPTTTNAEVKFICNSLVALSKHHKTWANDYRYVGESNEFIHNNVVDNCTEDLLLKQWFTF
ncbi:aminotransferase class V-fold PLP-dependent enzyme [Ichthyenterobacterium sp. W332]|uniref:Aminotransferase class V-fold PLP-dependent enzyme n=1 Tax=Microcosmobacter mediterraneus TaxID=3075607 RepID=A0ABU2YHJ0_9FLAO|nr:aminotransferase class V-fold PLP-dependent enzyme [Ichthyenterobacterium sp. W332]MDT0557487.1 aminotransferase class V-fold PLP-dependent enzyme [Ichthyenterobacterium sp. W332]